jgi:hypothetical protein
MRAQRGSVSVEFAAVLPLIAVAMLLVAQVGLLVAEQLAVHHAAREGARVAAVTNDDARARETAIEAGNLDPDRATVEVEPAVRDVGEPVVVRITYRPTLIPLIEAFVPDGLTLEARVSMRTEREPPEAPP